MEKGDKVIYIRKEKIGNWFYNYDYLTFGLEYVIVEIFDNKVKVVSNTGQNVTCPITFFVTKDEYNIYLREDKILKINRTETNQPN